MLRLRLMAVATWRWCRPQFPERRRGTILPRSVMKYLSSAACLWSTLRLLSAQYRHTLRRPNPRPPPRSSPIPPPRSRPSREPEGRPLSSFLNPFPSIVRLLAVARLFGFRLGADLALRLGPLAAEAALLAERLRVARSALRHLRVAGQLHVGLHLARGRVDLVGQLHRLVLEHVVGHAQVALELRHHVRVPQVDEPDVDGAEVLLHLVRDLLLAPVLHLDDLAALALHDAAQALDDLVHQVLGQVGPQEEDGLVLAQLRSRRVLRRPSAGLRLCLLHVLYLLGLPEVPPPARSTFSCASPFSPPASVGRRLNRFTAAAPSRSAATAASAATGTISSTTASSSAANLASTKSAGSHPCGGRPMPDRTRTKSGPRCCRRLFSPL